MSKRRLGCAIERAAKLRRQGLTWEEIAGCLGCDRAHMRTVVIAQWPELRKVRLAAEKRGGKHGERVTPPRVSALPTSAVAARVLELRRLGVHMRMIADVLQISDGAADKHVRALKDAGLLPSGPASSVPRKLSPEALKALGIATSNETRPCSRCTKPIPREPGRIWCQPCRETMHAMDRSHAA